MKAAKIERSIKSYIDRELNVSVDGLIDIMYLYCMLWSKHTKAFTRYLLPYNSQLVTALK